MSLSRKFSMVLESSDLEGAVTPASAEPVEETPELNQVEEEQLTQDIAKDEQAIEECSGCLEETLDEQSKLANQLETNEGVLSEPKTEDIIQSEVALEHALARLGTSREEQGMHYFTTKSMELSHEGVKDFLTKISNAIKELFRKAIMFFKKLFAKLRIKLGGYSKRIDKLVNEMKKLSAANDSLTDENANKVKDALNNMKLASVSSFVRQDKSSPFPLVNISTVVNDITKAHNELNDKIKKAKDMTIETLAKSMSDVFTFKVNNMDAYASTHAKGNKVLEELRSIAKNVEDIRRDDNVKNTKGVFPLGCAGDKLYCVGLVSMFEDDPEHSCVLKPLTCTYTEPISNFTQSDLKQVIQSFIGNGSVVKKSCDESDKIFKQIDGIQSKFENIITDGKINKDFDDTDKPSEVTGFFSSVAKNSKILGIDLPNYIIKVHVHTIRDYLVIGNAILKECGTESK